MVRFALAPAANPVKWLTVKLSVPPEHTLLVQTPATSQSRPFWRISSALSKSPSARTITETGQLTPLMVTFAELLMVGLRALELTITNPDPSSTLLLKSAPLALMPLLQTMVALPFSRVALLTLVMSDALLKLVVLPENAVAVEFMAMMVTLWAALALLVLPLTSVMVTVTIFVTLVILRLAVKTKLSTKLLLGLRLASPDNALLMTTPDELLVDTVMLELANSR